MYKSSFVYSKLMLPCSIFVCMAYMKYVFVLVGNVNIVVMFYMLSRCLVVEHL